MISCLQVQVIRRKKQAGRIHNSPNSWHDSVSMSFGVVYTWLINAAFYKWKFVKIEEELLSVSCVLYT